MPNFHVSQVRSGEGWILTQSSHAGPEVIADEMPDLMAGPLLVASDELGTSPPQGGDAVAPMIHALRGEAARRFLRDHRRWSGKGAIFASVPEVPDADARRRWIPDALRPWDAERLRATFYGQSGRRFHHEGVWFATEHDRRRYVEVAVSRLLKSAGLRLPNGDVALVLELPTDSTFTADFTCSGTGDAFRITRRFPERGFVRTWSIRRGDWVAEERKLPTPGKGEGVRGRGVQWLATAGIIALSIPTFAMVALVALVAKLTVIAASTSTTRLPPAAR